MPGVPDGPEPMEAAVVSDVAPVEKTEDLEKQEQAPAESQPEELQRQAEVIEEEPEQMEEEESVAECAA